MRRTARPSTTARALQRQLLGGLSPPQFLRAYWQKKPLLIRAALPGCERMVDREELLALAVGDLCHARLVWRAAGRYQLRFSPLRQAQLRAVRGKPWTVLVQDINHVLPAARALLGQFDFMPHARLDDLMASYATRGGGIGAHVDSYDVFLLQGAGRRRWQIQQHDVDARWVPDAPLRILRSFRPEREWILEPGDMLYLPPGVAHRGIALEECITFSIGFRAPSASELQGALLDELQERNPEDSHYRDPDLRAPAHPSLISAPMMRRCVAMLRASFPRRAELERFVGRYLSDPKPHVRFATPRRPLRAIAFGRTLKRSGIILDARTRMLRHGAWIFINGEQCRVPASEMALLTQLADRRALGPNTQFAHALALRLYQWYQRGYIHLNATTE